MATMGHKLLLLCDAWCHPFTCLWKCFHGFLNVSAVKKKEINFLLLSITQFVYYKLEDRLQFVTQHCRTNNFKFKLHLYWLFINNIVINVININCGLLILLDCLCFMSEDHEWLSCYVLARNKLIKVL